MLGSIGTAVYRGQVTDDLPADVPATAAGATEDTLAGALSVADRLPDATAARLVDLGREAFTSAWPPWPRPAPPPEEAKEKERVA